MAIPKKPARLQEWLEHLQSNHEASHLWTQTHDGRPIGDHSIVIEVWDVNRLPFVIIYSTLGCDLFTALPANRWDRSFIDAEVRLGILEVKPCKSSN